MGPTLFYAGADSDKEAFKSSLIDFKEGKLALTPEGAKLLSGMDQSKNLNLTFIFGNARSGKSFMMNCLSGVRGLFKVINSSQPCTHGVDISNYVPDHSKLVNHVKTYANVSDDDKGSVDRVMDYVNSGKGMDTKCGWVDVEGQGAEDGQYDTMLALPLLVTSKVVLFNHKGAPTVTHMLSQLGVLARAAEYIELGEPRKAQEEDEDESGAGEGPKKFGHLHVLFRDFAFEANEQEVYEQLMGMEKVEKIQKSLKKDTSGQRDPSKAAKERNDIRQLLLRNFQSINIWLFKQPANANDLKEHAELPEELVDPEFVETAKELLRTMTAQLATPVLFNGAPLTGPRISSLISQACTQLNEGGAINVPSVFRAMEKETVHRVADLVMNEFKKLVAKQAESLPQSESLLSKLLIEGAAAMVRRFDTELSGCLLEDEKKKKRKQLTELAATATDQLLKDNRLASVKLVAEVIQKEFSDVRSRFDEFCRAKEPKDGKALEDKFNQLKAQAMSNIASALASLEGVAEFPEYKELILEGEEKLAEFMSLKTTQNENLIKEDFIRKLQDDAIKQQQLMIDQNKKLEEHVQEERSRTAEMEARLAALKQQRDDEAKRTEDAQARYQKQQAELEKLRKKKGPCVIL